MNEASDDVASLEGEITLIRDSLRDKERQITYWLERHDWRGATFNSVSYRSDRIGHDRMVLEREQDELEEKLAELEKVRDPRPWSGMKVECGMICDDTFTREVVHSTLLLVRAERAHLNHNILICTRHEMHWLRS